MGCCGTLVNSCGTGVLEEGVGQPLGDGFGDHEEGATHGVVDPVVRGPAQAQALARDEAPRQLGHIAVVDPDMTIDIQIAGLFGVALHPAFTEFLDPCAGVAGAGQHTDLFTQRAYFGHAVESHDFAELPRRNAAQPFRTTDPTKGHEAQHNEYVQRAVEAPRQLQMLAQSAEQSIGTQGGQPAQDASHLNVTTRLESSRRTFGQANGGCDPLVGARAGRAHAAGRLCVLTTAFGLGTAGNPAALRLGARQFGNRLTLECLAQRRFLDADTPCHLGGAKALGKQLGTLRIHVRAHDRWLCSRGVAKERGRSVFAVLGGPIHQGPVRNEQRRSLQINRPDVAVFHQACQYKAPTLYVALRVREVVVTPNEIDHLAVTFENAQ